MYHSHDTNPEEGVDLRKEIEARVVTIIETLYASVLLRSGQVDQEEEANRRAVGLVEQLRKSCREGRSPPQKINRPTVLRYCLAFRGYQCVFSGLATASQCASSKRRT
ncbi:hypothetical protein BJX65DRAFT_291450 [Aspergillus insuetus]